MHAGSGDDCVQAFVSGEPVVVTFDVLSREESIPLLRANLEVISPHNEATFLELEIPGIMAAEGPSPWFASAPALGGYLAAGLAAAFLMFTLVSRKDRRHHDTPPGSTRPPS